MEVTASVKDLRKTLAEDCGIEAHSLIITELDGEGFHRTFNGENYLNFLLLFYFFYVLLNYESLSLECFKRTNLNIIYNTEIIFLKV